MKRIIIAIFTTLLYVSAYAQYETSWKKNLPDNNSINISSVSTFDDGYVVIGSFVDSISLNGNTFMSKGANDIFMLYIGFNGQIITASTFGDAEDEKPLTAVSNGKSVYVAGVSTGKSGKKLFVSSFDAKGNNFGKESFLMEGKAKFNLLQTESGSLFLGGSIKGNLYLDDLSIISHQNEHAFLLKLSDDIEPVWLWQTEGTGNHRLHSLEMDAEGNFVILMTVSQGCLSMKPATNVEFVGNGVELVKLDSIANPIWTKQMEGCDFVESVTVKSNDNGYVAGLNYVNEIKVDDHTYQSSGHLASLLIQFDDNGEIIWDENIDSDEYCRLMDIACYGNSTVCTGYHYGTLQLSESAISESKEKKAFLFGLDEFGELAWQLDVDGLGQNAGNKLIIEKDSSILVCGNEQAILARSEKGIIDKRCDRLFFSQKFNVNNERNSKESQTTSETINEDKSFANVHNDFKNSGDITLTVFPNPVKSIFQWKLTQNDDWLLELFNMHGVRLCCAQCKDQNSGFIDMSSWASGIYILKMSSSNNALYHTIIKN